jgi:hypothetical protein
LAIWILVAALLSDAPRLALKGTVGRDASGLIVVAVIAAWGYARSMSETARRLLPYLLLVLLGICGLAGIVQVVFGFTGGSLPLQFGRATGFMPNPVYFGGLMAGAALLAATLPRLSAAVRLTSVFFFGACSNLSGSRVATLAALLALVFVAASESRPERLSHRLAGPAAFLAGTAVAAVVGPLFTEVSSSTGRGFGEGGGRLQAWRYGLSATLDRPVSGWGFGRFRAATQGKFSADFVRVAAFDDVRQAWFDAHNLVINLLVSIGVIGLAIFCWWVWTSRHVSRPVMWFAVALALTWLAQPAGLATLPLAAIVWGAGTESAPQSELASRLMPPLPSLATAALMIIGLVGAGVLVSSDLRLRQALDSGEAGRIESAAAWFPGDAVVADLAAQAWFRAEQDDSSLRPKVLEWSRRAVDREPDRPYFWTRLGLRQAAFGDRDGAIESIERALALQPWHVQSWEILYAIGKTSDDAALVDRASEVLCSLDQEIEECVSNSG